LSQTGKDKCFLHTYELPVFISCSLELIRSAECHVAASKNTAQAVSLSLSQKKKKKTSRNVSAALECSGPFSDVLKEIGTKTREQNIFSVV